MFAAHRAIAAFLTAILVVLAGCRESGDEAPPLRVLAVGQERADALIADNVGMGLTTRDPRGLVIPGIAQSWRVADDGRSIVFRLRDAQFSNGREVTAADVVSSFRTLLRKPPADMRDLVIGIASVSSPLPDVVELVLTTAQPEMLELLADPAFAIRPAGTGGLRAGAYVRDTPDEEDGALWPGVHLVRQEHFFDPIPDAPARVTVASHDAEAAIDLYRNAAAEIVTGGSLDGLGLARTIGSADTLRLETSRAAMLLLVNHTSEPLGDRRVRRALSMAIDRDRLGPSLFGSTSALPVNGVAPSTLRQSLTGSEPDWASLPIEQRRVEARRLLEEAGYGVDNLLTIAIAATNSAADERLVAAVANDLAIVGVGVKLQRRTPAGHAAMLAKGDYVLALTTRSTPIASVLPFLGPLRCGRNPAGVCIPEADRLLAASWTAATPVDRAVSLASAERLWAEDAAVIGLVQPLNWSLVSRRIGGWQANESGVRPLRFLTFLPDRKLLP